MESGGVSGWGSSFFCPQSRGNKQSRGSENDDEYEYDDDDCLLWELENSTDGSTYNGSSSPGEAPIQNMPPCDVTMDNSTQVNNDDTAVESGDSVFSIHHRTEREKMKQFYSNGF